MTVAEPELPLKPVDYLLLLALHEGDRHGYGLVKDIERLSDGRVRLVPGNLYSVIARLVDAGMVREVPHPDAADSRRRLYALTPAGRRLLAAETRRLESLLGRPEIARVLRGSGRS